MNKITPQFDYLLCEEVKEESGAVTTTEVADHWQKYKVLEAGAGRPEAGDQGYFLMPMPCKVGDVILVQKHSEADTPPELKQAGLALIMASRVMAVVEA